MALYGVFESVPYGVIYLFVVTIRSKTFTFRSFIYNLFLRIAVGEAELYRTTGWNVIRKLLDESIDYIINSVEANVCYLCNDFAFEIGTSIYHHLFGYTEKYVSRLVEILGFPLLALFIAEKMKSITLALSSHAGVKSSLTYPLVTRKP